MKENIGKRLKPVTFQGNPPLPGHAYLMPALSVRPLSPRNVNPYPDGTMPTKAELKALRDADRKSNMLTASRVPEPGIDTIRHYLEIIPASVPNEHILFGAAHVRVTVGDLRLITGIGCEEEEAPP